MKNAPYISPVAIKSFLKMGIIIMVITIISCVFLQIYTINISSDSCRQKARYERIEATGEMATCIDLIKNGESNLLKSRITQIKALENNLAFGIRDNCTGSIDGYDLLSLAIKRGNIEIIKILIDSGVNLNRRTQWSTNAEFDNSGRTPLFEVISCVEQYQYLYHIDDREAQAMACQIMDILVANGADPQYIDKRGCSLLHAACGSETEGIIMPYIIVHILKKYNVDASLKDSSGDSIRDLILRRCDGEETPMIYAEIRSLSGIPDKQEE